MPQAYLQICGGGMGFLVWLFGAGSQPPGRIPTVHTCYSGVPLAPIVLWAVEGRGNTTGLVDLVSTKGCGRLGTTGPGCLNPPSPGKPPVKIHMFHVSLPKHAQNGTTTRVGPHGPNGLSICQFLYSFLYMRKADAAARDGR